MNSHDQRKRQLVLQGAVYRAQLLNSGRAVRSGSHLPALAAEAKHAAAAIVAKKFHSKQRYLKESIPVVLDSVAAAASSSTRYIRKPVLYGAMILGAISALPRFFKRRKEKQ
ncbi:MAG: hypothetical protein JWP38_3410 [Herbaspirillum sp.]|jgi:hypothetical protein|nr:hypothetical protein [Herbaspirillum sp.]